MPYSAIEKFLADSIGLDVDFIGKKNFERAVASLMEQTGLRDVESYLELLNTSPAEKEQLIEKVVVPETWFFRDVEPFIFLKKYIEDTWLPHNQTEILKVLSVPCSTGEEPYSIAMTLLETGLLPEQFHINAADISKKGLEYAKLAHYDKRAFRGKGVHYQNRYFHDTEKGRKLDARITGLVHFYHDNLLDPAFLANHEPYHIIFCRNLLIYLIGKARKKILAHLNRLLVTNGILFTGHSELSFFYQYGYATMKHPRSFACQKSEQDKQVTALKKTKKAPFKAKPTRHKARKPSKAHQKVPDRAEKPVEEKSESILTTVRTLADRGDLEKAYSLCEKLLEEQSTNAEVYYMMGLICHSLNRLRSAEEFFLKSIYLDPYYYEALVHLSLLYEQKGDTARSLLFKERAKRLHVTEKDNIPKTA